MLLANHVPRDWRLYFCPVFMPTHLSFRFSACLVKPPYFFFYKYTALTTFFSLAFYDTFLLCACLVDFLYQFSLVMFQTGKRRFNIQYHTDFHYIRLLVTAHFSYILYSRVQGLDGEGPSILVLHHLH
ncbi:hypothetical protein DEU56DRAFT_844708 [Suillus clintonianus]|uniref:uncharacterized protein n=1 Tax=Suillus clintonianus TaxID=1904413 RepID=UPI001B885D8E|nr:uncharacterized protein DEU56DRAFT_844708 [Suillus clintonianus]KAG2107823.1 hypothetical protein DEU56DRAFT_844708 [Suillus clintonianus]